MMEPVVRVARSLLNVSSHFHAFRELVELLTRHRHLMTEMAKREISDRYSGQFFGTFWAVGHPLTMIAVYIFIFNVVFKTRIGGTADMPLDYTVYLLSGLIPWLAFQESMSKASLAVVGNANLVKQVIFPIEALPVKSVLASLVTQCVFLAALTIYVVVTQRVLMWTYLLLPALIVVQALAMIGVSYVLSAVGVYVRDTKDFVQVFSLVGVYLMPTVLPIAARGAT